ncbi:hypothetical protein STA3757_01520 [Stanieria sp. NIES-3757]|nr:hypothetical protein STA3757_01520 [Stanieria sp. NIES-3757]
MEKLLKLKKLLLQGDIRSSLALVEELEKMVNQEEIINSALKKLAI